MFLLARVTGDAIFNSKLNVKHYAKFVHKLAFNSIIESYKKCSNPVQIFAEVCV